MSESLIASPITAAKCLNPRLCAPWARASRSDWRAERTRRAASCNIIVIRKRNSLRPCRLYILALPYISAVPGSGYSTPCSTVYCAVRHCATDSYAGYLPIMLHCASPTRRAPLRLLLPLYSRHSTSLGAVG